MTRAETPLSSTIEADNKSSQQGNTGQPKISESGSQHTEAVPDSARSTEAPDSDSPKKIPVLVMASNKMSQDDYEESVLDNLDTLLLEEAPTHPADMSKDECTKGISEESVFRGHNLFQSSVFPPQNNASRIEFPPIGSITPPQNHSESIPHSFYYQNTKHVFFQLNAIHAC